MWHAQEVIRSFGDAATEDIFHGRTTKEARSVPKELWPVCRRKLAHLYAANLLDDLRSPPGNRLEKLRGSLSGFWSIRVNDQYRVLFQWSENAADGVRIADYH